MVRSALLLLSLAVVALAPIAGCTPSPSPVVDPNTSDTERTTPPATPPTDEARTVPAVQAKTGQLVLADQGADVTTASGYDVSLQAGDLTGDAAVAVYEYELDDSARSQGILAAFQVAIPGAEATFANPVSVTVPLERAATPGTKLGVFMLAFPDELGLEASAENNAMPIYVGAGDATVSDSGLAATTTMVGANRRFVIAGAAPTGAGASNQKSQNQKHSLPDLTAEQDSDHVDAPLALLLIHGGFGTSDDASAETWGEFIQFFKRDHVLPNRFFLYRYWYDSSLSLSDNVDDLIARIGQDAKFQRFAILAHSRGGLVARELMHRADYADRIALVLTLATPHHGSPFGVPEWARLSFHGGYESSELCADPLFCALHPEMALMYRLKIARNWKESPELLYWLSYPLTSWTGWAFGDTPGGRALSWSNPDRAVPTAQVMTGSSSFSLKYSAWITGVRHWDGSLEEVDPVHIDLDLSKCSPQVACEYVQAAQSLEVGDAAYLQRYVCYGGYRDWDQESLGGSINGWLKTRLGIDPTVYGVSLEDVLAAIRGSLSDDVRSHFFLDLMGQILQTFLTNNGVSYEVNDGPVPLTSALYLEGAPSLSMATVKNAVSNVGDEPQGISGIQVRRCRLFPGLDHLDMVRDPRVFDKIAADLIELTSPAPDQPPVANDQSVTVAFNTPNSPPQKSS